MDLAEAMRTAVVDAATAAEDRVHWGILPQAATLPAVVMRAVGGVEDDPLEDDPDFFESRVQVDSFAGDHATAWALDAAVKTAIRAKAKTAGSFFFDVELGRPVDLSEEVAGKIRHRASSDFVMRHGADA